MPKIENGPLVGLKGTIGDYTFYPYKGSTYVRNKKRNVNENSLNNLKKQSSRMRGLSLLYQSTKETIVETIFRLEANRLKMQSGYNLFVKKNSKAFDEKLNIGDYSFLTLSAGTLDKPFKMRQRVAEDGILSIEWNVGEEMSESEGKDKLRVAVIYDDDLFGVVVPEIPDFQRNSGMAVIDLRKEGCSEAHVYCFFSNQFEDSFSESVYFNLNF